MITDRTLARTAGLLYLATFVTSIPALALKTPFLDRGDHPQLAIVGVILEILLAFCCVGTALTLYPVTRRQGEPLALGFLASRLLEAGIILVGVMAVMSLVTLRVGHGTGTATSEAETALIALHDWAFLLGPAVMAAVNALLLGTALYRGRLVPRLIPTLGLIGAPLLLASSVGVMFGAWDQVSAIAGVATIPVALWEFSLGVWLVAKGFQPGIATAPPVGVAEA
ncbi:MAG: DUF4386 domain-containing protein, partial [Thermomicrobiales bacterium]